MTATNPENLCASSAAELAHDEAGIEFTGEQIKDAKDEIFEKRWQEWDGATLLEWLEPDEFELLWAQYNDDKILYVLLKVHIRKAMDESLEQEATENLLEERRTGEID